MAASKKRTNQTKKKSTSKSTMKNQRSVQTYDEKQKEGRSVKWLILIVVLVTACIVAAIPLIDYLAMNRTYIKINKEKIGRLEYEYNFVVTREEQSELYASLMASFGMTDIGDFSNLTIHSDSTIKDGIDEAVVAGLIRNKMLLAEAEAEGFVYDTSEEYAAFEMSIQEAAEAAGVSVDKYVKATYGTYATLKRISEFVEEELTASAYYAYKEEQFVPTEEELQAYYEDNKEDLDSFDFWVTIINPEELEESEDLETVLKEAEANVLTEGTLYENLTMSGMDSNLVEWFYNADRKAGDTAVVKHSEKELYYALSFVERYLDESLTADIRLLKTSGQYSEELLELWKEGEATEESFAELCMTYSEDSMASVGGLYEGLVNGDLSDELNEWIYQEGREPGDTTALKSADGYEYVLYYVQQNDCKWKLTATDTITSERMTAYMEEITADVIVKTPGNKVSYE